MLRTRHEQCKQIAQNEIEFALSLPTTSEDHYRQIMKNYSTLTFDTRQAAFKNAKYKFDDACAVMGEIAAMGTSVANTELVQLEKQFLVSFVHKQVMRFNKHKLKKRFNKMKKKELANDTTPDMIRKEWYVFLLVTSVQYILLQRRIGIY